MNLIESLEKLAKEENINYTIDGLSALLATWETNKTPLINVLRNHPNWDEEKKMIIFKMDYERPMIVQAAKDFYSWMYRFDSSNNWRKSIEILYYNVTSELTEKQADVINGQYPELRVREGQKTTRATNKLAKKVVGLTTHRDYNRRFAQFADSISPMTISKYTCLSVNPIDYLLMSNGNSWTTCQTVKPYDNGKRGCHCTGTLSYMLDKSSFVYYTVDSSYDGDSVEFEPKMERQIFAYGEEKLLQSRLYPQSNEDQNTYTAIRNTVQKIIADCLGVPNYWTKHPTADGDWMEYIEHDSDYTHYLDYEHTYACNVSTLKDSTNENRMSVGHSPVCLVCGRRYYSEKNLDCGCLTSRTCAHCGKVHEETLTVFQGQYYCPDCIRWCDRCDTYHIHF